MKECTKCGETKSFIQFTKDKRNLNGLQSWCKNCIKESRLEFYKTKDGLISKIYSRQIQASKQRNHNEPQYTLQWLKNWLFGQELFHNLYKEWAINGFDVNLIPSVDRKDDYKGYTKDNIQIMTWGENRNKGHQYRTIGKNNKQNKSVLQFTKDMALVKEYHSLNEARRQTGVSSGNISECCSGSRKSAGGFIWKYKVFESDVYVPDIF